MKIELLGDNCRTCRMQHHNITLALQEMAVQVEYRKIDDPQRFAEYGLMSLPGLVINGQLRSVGKLLTTGEIMAILTEAR